MLVCRFVYILVIISQRSECRLVKDFSDEFSKLSIITTLCPPALEGLSVPGMGVELVGVGVAVSWFFRTKLLGL